MGEVKKSDFEEVMPYAGENACQVVFESFPAFMEKVSEWFEWAFDENGQISSELAAKFCAIDCLREYDTCPNLTINQTVTQGNQRVIIKLTGDFTTEYTYSVYKSLTSNPSDWGEVVKTGNMSNHETNIDITNLTNETHYYFKLVVSKTGCDDIVSYCDAVPTACENIFFDVSAIYDSQSNKAIIKGRCNNMPEGFPVGAVWTCYRSINNASALGSPIASGTISSSDCQPDNDGKIGICVEDTNLTAEYIYYYAIGIKSAQDCPSTYYNKAPNGIIATNGIDDISQNPIPFEFKVNFPTEQGVIRYNSISPRPLIHIIGKANSQLDLSIIKSISFTLTVSSMTVNGGNLVVSGSIPFNYDKSTNTINIDTTIDASGAILTQANKDYYTMQMPFYSANAAYSVSIKLKYSREVGVFVDIPTNIRIIFRYIVYKV